MKVTFPSLTVVFPVFQGFPTLTFDSRVPDGYDRGRRGVNLLLYVFDKFRMTRTIPFHPEDEADQMVDQETG